MSESLESQTNRLANCIMKYCPEHMYINSVEDSCGACDVAIKIIEYIYNPNFIGIMEILKRIDNKDKNKDKSKLIDKDDLEKLIEECK